MNKRIRTTPYLAIWSGFPLVLLLLFIDPHDTYDLQMHDTYFVFEKSQLSIVFAIVFGLLGFLYWVFRKHRLISWLSTFHVVITIVTCLWFCLLPIIKSNIFQSTPSWQEYEFYKMCMSITYFLVLGFIIAQSIFILNLVLASIKGKK